MKIIAIVNQKGGAGKSTQTCIFSKATVAAGKRTLIVDTDPQGGISSFFLPRLKPGEFRKGALDILMGERPTLGENVYNIDKANLEGVFHIIPADHRLDKIYATISPYSLEDALKDFVSNYDYVFIDTPPTVQGITRAAIYYADRIIVPCEANVQSLQPTEYSVSEIISQKKDPLVLFVGWKEPTDNGFVSYYARLFDETFKNHLLGIMPKTITSVSFAVGDKKITKSVREGVIATALDILEKAK
ncbi:ParA family protein [Leptospira sp. P2653]|uniref:ParA family protein n=1 Tax=Leptospira sp. P2653 TaxID=1218600 RepID=UPI0002BDCE5C|nr:ParA family protein [Leptospira sp. P2653]EMJ63511.1 AAA domain protein [Leptospira sp. P2653]